MSAEDEKRNSQKEQKSAIALQQVTMPFRTREPRDYREH